MFDALLRLRMRGSAMVVQASLDEKLPRDRKERLETNWIGNQGPVESKPDSLATLKSNWVRWFIGYVS